jgi:probable selenium-dependent hydroxylase accessory protein YqeC
LILNEADGARSMSIKMSRPGEPVLMQGAQYLVPVIGLDCLNRPLGPDTVFRWELAAKLTSLQAGRPLTPELAASVVCHREGICKDWHPGMRIIAFINKVDSPSQDALALALAHELLQNRNFPVERVIWASLHEKRADSLSSRRQ